MNSPHLRRAGLAVVTAATLTTLTGLPAVADGTGGPSPVVVKAADRAITYGQADPSFGFTSTGFAAGDDFSTAPTCGVTGAHANAGTYPITCSGATSTATTTTTPTSHSITVQTANPSARGVPDPTVQGHLGTDPGDTGSSGWGPAKSVPFAPNPYAAVPGTNYVDLLGTVLNDPPFETFRVPFDLPAGATNIAVNGVGFADDSAGVYVGSTQIGQVSGFYTGQGDAFGSTVQSLFASGRNYLFFTLNNSGGGPGAVDFQATITYDTATTQPKYAFSYEPGTLTVTKAPLTVSTSSTSSLVSLLTFGVRYTTVVKNAVTGAAAAGVPVTTRVDGGSVNSGCTAVTDASGVATCTSGALQISINAPFQATVPETANYRAGSGSGTTSLF